MKELTVALLILTLQFIAINTQKQDAIDFLAKYNKEIAQLSYASSDAAFKKATNITTENTKIAEEESLKYSKILKEIRKNATKINLADSDEDTKRQFKLLLMTMTSNNENIVRNVTTVGSSMENIYSTGRVPYDSKIVKSIQVDKDTTELSLDKHLGEIMKSSTDPQELLYAWKGWRDAVGPKLKDKYTEYVRLNNIGAKQNNYEDAGDYKRKIYEENDLQKVAENFWIELKPFYEEVHAYVRHRLSDKYGDLVKDGDPIPAHLLGNMWGQSWENIFHLVTPFKGEPTLNIDAALQKDYDVNKMFKKAEEFFVSIGWEKLPDRFWNKTLFVEPTDRNVTCHASAWDFGIEVDGSKDVRVKMCTKKTQDDFITIHHELGHIYYYLLYWNQSQEYRTGANPGFHEAVGDTLVLSVQTPNHLKEIGLLTNVSNSDEADINFLLKTAMERIAFLPFGYLMDQWMWGVYSGKIQPKDYNKVWWEMRLKYQGMKPPVERNDDTDFDPGAKYHIPADTPYIRYFFAHILQFTFHKRACDIAGESSVLHKCSIYKSKEAGKALGDMLKLGKSKKWQDALEQYTGSKTLSAQPITEYFQPLNVWLKKQRSEHGYTLGWEKKTNVGASLKMHFLTYLSPFVILSYIVAY